MASMASRPVGVARLDHVSVLPELLDAATVPELLDATAPEELDDVEPTVAAPELELVVGPEVEAPLDPVDPALAELAAAVVVAVEPASDCGHPILTPAKPTRSIATEDRMRRF